MSRERAERTEQPPIDLPNVLGRVKAGDEAAATELYGYLQPKLHVFFARRLPTEAEDLTQVTITEVMAALPKFDPSTSRKDLASSFGGWTFTIARSALNMELRRVLGRGATPFSDVMASRNTDNPSSMSELINDRGVPDQRQNVEEEATRENIEDLVPAFRDKLVEILSPGQLETVTLRMSGKSIDEIVEELGSTKRAVLNRMLRAREKIEDDLIYPAGFRQVADFQDGALSQAASKGRLEAVKLLGLWYTTDEWVQRYSLRRRIIDGSLQRPDYVLLTEETTPDEYGTLLGTRYTDLMTRHQGRIYISRAGLEDFRANRRRANKRFDSPGEEYRQLRDFAATTTEYSRLQRAASSGEIPAVKESEWWFVKPEDVETYFNSSPTSQAEPRNEARPTPVTRDIVVYDASLHRELLEEDTPEVFASWFFSTAKVVSDQRLPWRKRRKIAQPDDLGEAVDAFTDQMGEWLKRRDVTLYPSFIRILNLKLTGKTNKDVADEIGWTVGSVTSTLSQIRSVIEERLIKPAGITRLSSYKDESLTIAAISGRLDAIWFLGKWYSTEEKLREYLAERKV